MSRFALRCGRPCVSPPALPCNARPRDGDIPVAGVQGTEVLVAEETPGCGLVLGVECRERRCGGPCHPHASTDQHEGDSTERPEGGADRQGAIQQEVLASGPGGTSTSYPCVAPLSTHEPSPGQRHAWTVLSVGVCRRGLPDPSPCRGLRRVGSGSSGRCLCQAPAKPLGGRGLGYARTRVHAVLCVRHGAPGWQQYGQSAS